MLNAHGDRFVDEGADFRNFTYAKYGREILRQPGGYAFQVFDHSAQRLLREEEYGSGIVQAVFGDTLEELAEKLQPEGLEDRKKFVETINDYNRAVHSYQAENPQSGSNYDPSIKDGLSTQSQSSSLKVPKSNWAVCIESPRFQAVKVACGITFTFGGLAINPETAEVLSEATKSPIKGLFCCGELVGGLFYSNYPGGSGLTAGAVLGRKAGIEVAKLVT